MTERNLGLSVELSVALDGLTKGLAAATGTITSSTQRMQAELNGFRSGMEATFAPLRFLTAGLGALAVGGLAIMAKGLIDTTDKLAKTASGIGVTAEWLQQLNYAAGMAGVEVDAAGRAMEIFTRNLGDARNGTGALVASLKQADPALLKNLTSARDTGEAFLHAADAIAGIEDPARRAALASDLFGKSSASMINLLKDGSAGYQAMAKEARELGVVLSNETVAAAERANDALGQMGAIIQANVTKAVISATPAVLALARGFAELAPAVARWADSLLPDELASSEELLKRLAQAARIYANAIQSNSGGAGSAAAKSWEEQIVALQKILTLRKADEAAARAQFSGGSDRGDKGSLTVRTPGTDAVAEGLKLIEASRGAAEKFRIELERIDDLELRGGLTAQQAHDIRTKAYQEHARALRQNIDLTRDAGDVTEEQAVDMGKLEEAWRRVAAAHAEELQNWYAQEFSVDQTERQNRALEKQASELERNKNLAHDLGLTFASAFEDAVVQQFMDGVVDLQRAMRALMADILRLLLREAITKPMLGSFGGSIGPGATSSSEAPILSSAGLSASFAPVKWGGGGGGKSSGGGGAIVYNFYPGVQPSQIPALAAAIQQHATQGALRRMRDDHRRGR